MNPQIVTIGLTASSANNIALSQTPGAAGNLTLNGAAVTGGVATLDHQRRILVTTAANESAKTLTITGTRADGAVISEVMTGPNATTGQTLQDFLTVTSVAVSAAFTGAVTVGTSGVGSSPWQNVSPEIAPFALALAAVVTGTINYTVEYTYDDPNTAAGGNIMVPGTQLPTVWALAALSAKAATTDACIGTPTLGPIWGWRVTQNSNTPPGSVTVTGRQAGIKSGGG
jgi:hypothetical protein